MPTKPEYQQSNVNVMASNVIISSNLIEVHTYAFKLCYKEECSWFVPKIK